MIFPGVTYAKRSYPIKSSITTDCGLWHEVFVILVLMILEFSLWLINIIQSEETPLFSEF